MFVCHCVCVCVCVCVYSVCVCVSLSGVITTQKPLVVFEPDWHVQSSDLLACA